MSITNDPAFLAAVQMVLSPTEKNRLAFVRAMEQADERVFVAVGGALREAYTGNDAMWDQLLGTLTLLRMRALQPITPSTTIVSPAEGEPSND